MTENKDKLSDKDNEETQNEIEVEKGHEMDKDQQHKQIQALKEQQPGPPPQQQPPPSAQQHLQHDRCKRLLQFLDMLNIPRHHHGGGHSGSSSSGNISQSPTPKQHTPNQQQSPLENSPLQSTSQQPSPQSLNANFPMNTSNSNSNINIIVASKNNKSEGDDDHHQQQQEQQHHLPQQHGTFYNTTCVSFQSEIFLMDLINREFNDNLERSPHKEEYGTQRVYKKTSPNCVLTLYLPSREISLSGNSPSILRGIVYVDPKAIQGYCVYAQLTLTFRYGREDEEVMGLRFCNEAIMSLHQIWPRKEEPTKDTLSPLQDALLKRLGDGAHPFTLTLTAQAPPSVQLVPAKRYYGAPIGTSYDVRCFIADKTDEKFHRKASVKMGVRVIYRTDVFNQQLNGSENCAALLNNSNSSPPITLTCTNTQTTTTPPVASSTNIIESATVISTNSQQHQQQHNDGLCSIAASVATSAATTSNLSSCNETRLSGKARKSERGDSFPKLRLSPKAFRFSNRFSRSKSEVEKCTNDAFYNYSKSFQEYDSICATASGGGPQGAVDKPFLLQDGRVALRASLDKAWYTHGEDVCVSINIRNDSRKTVRKIRVCAIQHVDVCMFNNGKFKNVVADSDQLSPPPIDHHVAPGANLITTLTLKPQRGVTKNWIALEDTLQRSTEPDEITGQIAASALRTPHFLMQAHHSPTLCSSPAIFIPPLTTTGGAAAAAPAQAVANTSASNSIINNDERNVFAIYVSYYVKVKLTLSGMGGELSLKLPFLLVHIDEEQRKLHEMTKIKLNDVPAYKKNVSKTTGDLNEIEHSAVPETEGFKPPSLDHIETVINENIQIKVSSVDDTDGDGVVLASLKDEDQVPCTSSARRRRFSIMRSETIDMEDDLSQNVVSSDNGEEKLEQTIHIAQIHSGNNGEEQQDLSETKSSKYNKIVETT